MWVALGCLRWIIWVLKGVCTLCISPVCCKNVTMRVSRIAWDLKYSKSYWIPDFGFFWTFMVGTHFEILRLAIGECHVEVSTL